MAPREEPESSRKGLFLILALGLVLQLWVWHRGRGYPLADSVEYLERAKLFVEGAPLDPGTVRSFAFSALLVPVVALFRALGDEAVLAAARVCTMLLGLATVAVVARLGARLAGPRAGLAAAAVLACNPVFLQWTVEPLSGTAAMLCVALAALSLAERGGFKRGLVVGAWMGLALLMAFQSLSVLAAFFGMLLLRDRWRGRAHVAGFLTAVSLALLAQALLDKAMYGSFGSSLWEYAKENVAGTLSSKLYMLGDKTGSEAITNLARKLYNAAFANADQAGQEAGVAIRSRYPRTWYVTHLHTLLFAWPILCLVALGALRSLARPRWTTSILIATVLSNAVVMSVKGEQSFRLWLPLLPMLAVITGVGFAWLASARRAGPLLRAAALLLLAAGLVQGLGIVRAANLRKHGGYWDAMELVRSRRADGAGAPERLASGYHWATLLRSGGTGLTQVKLSYPLYDWPKLGPEARALVISELAGLDWFVSHTQLYEQDPALAAVLAQHFEIVGAFYERAAYEELQPVLVFRRAPAGAPARRLFELDEHGDPGAVQAVVAHPVSLDLRRRYEEGAVDQLVLLGWEAEVLPGDGNVGWLALHWYAGPTHGRDYTISTRLTDPYDRARQINRLPCYGARPTSTWSEGSVISDGLPFALPSAWDDLGGDYCRGDLVPLRLWVAAPRYEVQENEPPRLVAGLSPFHPSGLRPVHKEKRGERLVSDEGYVFSTDNLVLAGGFFVPVPAAARVPDDGQPLAR